MKTKIAINGFGRIGRNAFKIAHDRSDLEIVAVNDLTDTKTLAHLLKHDSNYGAYDAEVGYDEENLIVNGQKIRVLAEKDPATLPWGDLGVEVVIESTGFFVDPAKAQAHITAGAKKVVLSAPAKGEGATTIVLGVNEDQLKVAGEIISNASCTTNCITPVMAVLEQNFGIDKAMMTTVHSYTASQKLQDAPAKDLREARNAAENIVPTTTGASIAAAKALPALEGIFGGLSVRVPTPVVSLSDFVVVTKKEVTVDEVNEVFKKAAADPFYQGILDVTEEELVSSDFIGNSHSCIVDLKLTNVVGGNLLKVVAWYDNEWGYSNRLVEVTADVGKLLQGGDAGEAPQTSDAQTQPAEQPAETNPAPVVSPGPAPVEQPSPSQQEPMLPAGEESKEELLPPPADQPAPAFTPTPAPEEPMATADITQTPSTDLSAEQPLPAPAAQQTPQPAPVTNPNGSIDGFRRF